MGCTEPEAKGGLCGECRPRQTAAQPIPWTPAGWVCSPYSCDWLPSLPQLPICCNAYVGRLARYLDPFRQRINVSAQEPVEVGARVREYSVRLVVSADSGFCSSEISRLFHDPAKAQRRIRPKLTINSVNWLTEETPRQARLCDFRS